MYAQQVENAYGRLSFFGFLGFARAMAEPRTEIRWPLLGDFRELGDPTAPGYPDPDFLADVSAKYARSTDFRFFRRQPTSWREGGVYEHRPRLLTGPSDFPPTDPFIGSELCRQGLIWARSPLPDSWVDNPIWGPIYMHQTHPTVELLGGCIFPLKTVDYSVEQRAAHFTVQEDLAERFKRLHAALPLCTARRYLGSSKGPPHWAEKTHEVHCAVCKHRGHGHKRTIWKGGHELSEQHIEAYTFIRRRHRSACTNGGGVSEPNGPWHS